MVTRRWSDLGKRVGSALLMAPVALACIWVGAGLWVVAIAALALGLAWEWVHLCHQRARDLPGLAVPLALLAAGVAVLAGPAAAAFAVLALGCAATWAVARRGMASRPALWLAAGVVYVGLAGIALILLRRDGDAGRANVLFLILVVWASDTGAYLAGRLLRGPRLAPAISPGKTWSGAAGGVAVAMAAGVAVAWLSATGWSARAALVAAGLSVAAQSGDLLESWLKRRFGVKDSGRLIPGHGGLLDRLDGVLAAAPAACMWALALGPGVLLWR